MSVPKHSNTCQILINPKLTPIMRNSRMHEAYLAMSAIIDESGEDRGLQQLGSRQTLEELEAAAIATARALRNALNQRTDWAAHGIHR